MPKPLIAAALLCLAPPMAPAQSASLDGAEFTLAPIASDLQGPVFLTAAAGDPRLFVVEQPGTIIILDKGAARPSPFADLTESIRSGGVQGLLGLAFHPGYAANGRFFVAYTDPTGDLIIAEMAASSDPNRADPASLKPLLTVPHRDADNHNGGWIGFGPDGLLYIGTGDGGGGGDEANNAQNPDQLLGKILRIDVDKAAPYAIPPANPFAKGGGAPEIFVLGTRNPWRASFDGDQLYIGDVGQGEWEEIDVISTADAGANLGWRVMEGRACFNAGTCDTAGLTLPIHVFDHNDSCSVTGGYVYRGPAMPALQGRYFFSDFCSGALMSLRLQQGTAQQLSNLTPELGSLGPVTSFGQDAAGEIYVLTMDGTVSKLVPAD